VDVWFIVAARSESSSGAQMMMAALSKAHIPLSRTKQPGNAKTANSHVPINGMFMGKLRPESSYDTLSQDWYYGMFRSWKRIARS
jgi:hypothetical protein